MNKLNLILFIITSFILQIQLSQAQCHIDDWTALKALYESTDGDNWTDNKGWQEITGNAPSANCNLENLYGISLNNNDRVTCIDMDGKVDCILSYYGGNNLRGNLPPEFGKLSFLTNLFLTYNQLNGSIPPELGNLSNLRKIYLNSNQFSGSIPSELGSLSNLIELDLTLNELTGSIPAQLGNLSMLEILNLPDNQLAGEIPPQLGDLGNLKILSLYFNHQITGEIPIELTNLSNLEALNLGSNQLGGLIPEELSNLIKLKSLRLGGNKFIGSIPPQLGDLSNLTLLELSYNQLTGRIPPELGDLSSLANLWLNNTGLSGSIPLELGNLSKLEYLWLHGNQLTGSIPSELGNLSKLEYLWLYTNNLSGEIPTQLSNLSKLKHLQLHSNQFSGSIPPALSNLINLEYLYLSDNNLGGCYNNNLSLLCSQLLIFSSNVYISDGNNFDDTWENFCAINAGACPPPEQVPTNHSGDVTLNLNNNQNIIKNKVATVYDCSTCPDYTNISNCNPVVGFNNLSANEALWVTTKAAEYFSTNFNVTIPHINIVVNDTESPNNAKYKPSHNLLVLGAGDGTKINAMTAPDIVGHEYAHAIIRSIKNLGNYKISGAFNESYADIFGELIEQFCIEQNNDWVYGSQVVVNTVGNYAGLRNLANPNDETMKYQLPNTYKGVYWIDIDNSCFHKDYCGIHTNSGVHSYWFNLLANGGSGYNDNGHSYTINRIGIEKAAAIAFENLKNYLSPQSTYIDAREGSVCVANTNYSNEPVVLETIKKAWDAVGVYKVAENPIQFRITNAYQTDPITNVNDTIRLPIQFDLSIDSLGMDLTADELCFSLHLPDTYQNLTINKVYEPLTDIEIIDTENAGELKICINRINNGVTKNGGIYNRIASRSSIIQFGVCIVSDNLKGGNSTIKPIDISGYTKAGFDEIISFESRSLPFGFDYSDISINPNNMLEISLVLNHKNCQVLGALAVEVLNNNIMGVPPYIYRLKTVAGTPIGEKINPDNTHQFYNLEEGEYELKVEDSNNNRVSKIFNIDFVGKQNGSICCAENLMIPPGFVRGVFNADDTISLSEGTLILEATLEICED